MKKILAVAIGFICFFNALAARSITLVIDNQTDVPVKISDQDNNESIINPNTRDSMKIKVHKQYDGYAPVPNADMPRATTIIVTETATNQSNSIDVDDDTKRLIIKTGLRLELEKR